jgi:hypothetical protein
MKKLKMDMIQEKKLQLPNRKESRIKTPQRANYVNLWKNEKQAIEVPLPPVAIQERSELVVEELPRKTRIFDELEKDASAVYLTPDLELESFIEKVEFPEPKKSPELNRVPIIPQIKAIHDSERMQSYKGLKMISVTREKKIKTNELLLKKEVVKTIFQDFITKPNSFGIQVSVPQSNPSILSRSSLTTTELTPNIYRPRRRSTIKEVSLEYIQVPVPQSNPSILSRSSLTTTELMPNIYSPRRRSTINGVNLEYSSSDSIESEFRQSKASSHRSNKKEKKQKIHKEADSKPSKMKKPKEYSDINISNDEIPQKKKKPKKEVRLKSSNPTSINDTHMMHKISYVDAIHIEDILKTSKVVTRDIPQELYLDFDQDMILSKLLLENSKLIKNPKPTKEELSQFINGSKKYEGFKKNSTVANTKKEENGDEDQSIKSYSDLSSSNPDDDMGDYDDGGFGDFRDPNEGSIAKPKREITNMAAEKVVWGLFKTAALANIEVEVQKPPTHIDLTKESVRANDEPLKMKNEKYKGVVNQKMHIVNLILKTENENTAVEGHLHVLDAIRENLPEEKQSFAQKHTKKRNDNTNSNFHIMTLSSADLNISKRSIQNLKCQKSRIFLSECQKSKTLSNSSYQKSKSHLNPELFKSKRMLTQLHASALKFGVKPKLKEIKSEPEMNEGSIQTPKSQKSRIFLYSEYQKSKALSNSGYQKSKSHLNPELFKSKRMLTQFHASALKFGVKPKLKEIKSEPEMNEGDIAYDNISSIGVQDQVAEPLKNIIEELKDDNQPILSNCVIRGSFEGSIASLAPKRKNSTTQSRISLKPLPKTPPPPLLGISVPEETYIDEETEALKTSSWIPDFKVFLI